ncbi:MAG TPA: hypothetical protein VK217_10910, partial [Acidimicrobiales bacterium]|nr:hypothetical protein [Acidimicrobiales bacterium]
SVSPRRRPSVVYGFRFRLVLTEDNPSYPGYNEKLWSQLPRPEPHDVLACLTGPRTANVALLRNMDDWQRWGTHGEQGSEQIDLMVAKIAGHDLAHLNQLARTIAVAVETTALGVGPSKRSGNLSRRPL